MKILKKMTVGMLAFCLAFLVTLSFSDSVYAKKITSMKQAATMAQKKVKNADIVELDRDYKNGQLVYEIQLIKKNREYDITYRASDGKMLSYGWEEYNVQRNSKKKDNQQKQMQAAGEKEAPGGTILSLVKKYDDGILVYKVKMKKASKNYTLKYHAKTGRLLEYEWKLTTARKNPSQQGNAYIGITQAKKIAISQAPKATVIKAEFDMDDGIPVYEIELIQGFMEYDIKIHAKTGKILEIERENNGINW